MTTLSKNDYEAIKELIGMVLYGPPLAQLTNRLEVTAAILELTGKLNALHAELAAEPKAEDEA